MAFRLFPLQAPLCSVATAYRVRQHRIYPDDRNLKSSFIELSRSIMP